jgi:hypothetical protein
VKYEKVLLPIAYTAGMLLKLLLERGHHDLRNADFVLKFGQHVLKISQPNAFWQEFISKLRTPLVRFIQIIAKTYFLGALGLRHVMADAISNYRYYKYVSGLRVVYVLIPRFP